MSELVSLAVHRDRRRVNRRVGMNVRIVMMMRGVGQPALAHAVGLTQPSVSRKLTGATAWTPDELEAAANLLEVPVSRLFEELPDITPHNDSGSVTDRYPKRLSVAA